MIIPNPTRRRGADQNDTTMTNTDQIEAEVIYAFRGLVGAAEALDASAYFDCIDQEKFSGLSADGKAWHSFSDLETVITNGFDMVQKITFLEFSNLKVTVINPLTAILVNEYQQTILLKNGGTVQQSGGGVQVWSKSDDGWKLVSIGASDASQRAKAVF